MFRMSTACRKPAISCWSANMHCTAFGICCVWLPKIWLGELQDGFGGNVCIWKLPPPAGGRMVIPMPRSPSTGGGRVHWVNPHAFGKFTAEPGGGCQAGGGNTRGWTGCMEGVPAVAARPGGGCQAGGGGNTWPGCLSSHAWPLGPSGTPHRCRRYLGGQSAHTHTSIYIYPHRHTYIYTYG